MDKMAAVAEVEGFDMNNFTPMQCDLASLTLQGNLLQILSILLRENR